jgi:hypothetical protein
MAKKNEVSEVVANETALSGGTGAVVATETVSQEESGSAEGIIGNQIAALEGAPKATAESLPIIVGNATKEVVTVGGFEFEIAKQVTRPVLQQKDNTPIYVIFDGPIIQAIARASDADDAKAADKKPPKIAPVTNLETGELQTLICNAVLANEISEKYANDTYVGRAFRFISRTESVKGGGSRRLRVYDIVELRPKA